MIAPLALTLLVLGIFTDNHDLTLAFNDFALFADFLDRRSDFHLNYTSSKIFLLFKVIWISMLCGPLSGRRETFRP